MNNYKILKLIQAMSRYKKIYIYGAGNIAKQINPFLCNKVEGVIVTEKDNEQKDFLGKPIYKFEEFKEEIKNKNISILIAVGENLETEIEQILIKNEITNYIKISRYKRTNCIIKDFEGKTKEEYLKNIAEWYGDENGDNNFDISIIISELTEKQVYSQCDYNSVIIILEHVSQRAYKMIKALYNYGIYITVIIGVNANRCGVYDKLLIEIKKICNRFIEGSCIEEMMYWTIMSRGKIVHFFTAWGDCTYAYFFLKQKEVFGRIIIERYDVFNCMRHGIDEKQMKLEKYCIEKADGICARDYAIQYLSTRNDFDIRGKILYFPDYYERTVSSQLINDDKKELSLCYVGSIPDESLYKNSPYNCLLEFIDMCEQHKCHFHIYYLSYEKKYIKKLYAKERKYLHVYEDVEYESMLKELQHYDYGIMLSKGKKINCRDDAYSTENDYIYSTGNKFYDYLCAGLPIISYFPIMVTEDFVNNRVAIRWSLEDFDFDELLRRRKKMKENVLKNRETWCIENHVKELISFYKNLLTVN